MAKKEVKQQVTELPDGPADDNGLTPRQLKILSVIKKAVEDQGYPPSMREIGQAAGLSSTASVTYQLQILEEKVGSAGMPLVVGRLKSLFLVKMVRRPRRIKQD